MREYTVVGLLIMMVFVPCLVQGQEGAIRAPGELDVFDPDQVVVVEPEYPPPADPNAGETVGQADNGTTSESLLVIPVAVPVSPNSFAGYQTYVTDSKISVYDTSGLPSGYYYFPVLLPSGALITRIGVDACDTDPVGSLTYELLRGDAPPSTPIQRLTFSGSTGDFETPGCGFFHADLLEPPLVVDNGRRYYWVRVQWFNVFADPTAVTLQSVRVHYKLQVSPAPATATFNDVPTADPFFQHIEALVASGITAGCGGGDYCPDEPLTRGQMAVFLAEALGLYHTP